MVIGLQDIKTEEKMKRKICDRNMMMKKTKKQHLIEDSVRMDITLTSGDKRKKK